MTDRKAFIREEWSPDATTTAIFGRSLARLVTAHSVAPSPFPVPRLAVREVIARRENGFFPI